MKDLIAKLEAAPEGSRELDDAIFEVVTGKSAYQMSVAFGDIEAPLRRMTGLPHYTTSLDAALTLAPEGWDWLVRNDGDGAFANLTRGGTPIMLENEQINPDWQDTPTLAANGALALCVACLRARPAMEAE